jgi:hypothetical protein
MMLIFQKSGIVIPGSSCEQEHIISAEEEMQYIFFCCTSAFVDTIKISNIAYTLATIF